MRLTSPGRVVKGDGDRRGGVHPIEEDKAKAYVGITFDHCFVVHDLKIIEEMNGLFVAMPSRRREDGVFKDTAHPPNTETRRMSENRVLNEYRQTLQRRGDPTGSFAPKEEPAPF